MLPVLAINEFFSLYLKADPKYLYVVLYLSNILFSLMSRLDI